jgi:hypothetical protein|tara:strand:+ start:197 stop:400 length:204 start_codon:yes stop_codon:yes gene_type:complete
MNTLEACDILQRIVDDASDYLKDLDAQFKLLDTDEEVEADTITQEEVSTMVENLLASVQELEDTANL